MPSTLRNRSDFNKLWFGQTVSNLGDRVSRIALPSVALLTLNGSALDVGILGALRFLPFLLLGPVAGVWADRLSRRTLMITADVGRLLATAAVPLAYATDTLTMPLLYAVAAVVGVLTVIFEVSYQAYLPALVGREGVLEGNQKLQSSRSIAEVAGAALGGFLMQAIGIALAVLADAASFAVSLLGLVMIRHRDEQPGRRPGSTARPGALSEAREGLRALLSDRRLRALMSATATVNIGMATANTLLLVYAYDSADLGPGQVGAAFAVGTVGLILGAVLARQVASLLPLSTVLMGAIVLTGLSYVILPAAGVDAAFVGLIAVQFVVGFADSVFNIHVLSLVQTITPDELMGRVNGTALSVVWGSGTFGAMLGGLLGTAIGAGAGVGIAGGVVVLGALFIFFSPVRAIREQPAPPRPEPMPDLATGGSDS